MQIVQQQRRTFKRGGPNTPVVIVHRDVACSHHIQQVITRFFEHTARLVICYKVQVPDVVSVSTRV